MMLLPMPDAEGIAKTKEIVFNRSGRTLSDEEASRLIGGLMRYLYILRRLDDELHASRLKNDGAEATSDEEMPGEKTASPTGPLIDAE